MKVRELNVALSPNLVIKFSHADMKTRFEVVEKATSPNEALHIASLTQEAFLLFVIETLRFKTPSVVKIHKLGNVCYYHYFVDWLLTATFQLVAKFKPIRSVAVEILRDMAASLESMGAQDGTSEKRREFVDLCSLECSEVTGLSWQ